MSLAIIGAADVDGCELSACVRRTDAGSDVESRWDSDADQHTLAGRSGLAELEAHAENRASFSGDGAQDGSW